MSEWGRVRERGGVISERGSEGKGTKKMRLREREKEGYRHFHTLTGASHTQAYRVILAYWHFHTAEGKPVVYEIKD